MVRDVHVLGALRFLGVVDERQASLVVFPYGNGTAVDDKRR